MTVGVVVAGLGWLGESLIKDLQKVPSLELVGVQDVVPGRAAEIAERYGARLSSEVFEDLLADARVEVVAICTPNAFHAHQAQQALAAGKHVLVQKPLALSFADAQATLDAARTCERLLFVDYTYRFLETMSAMRAELSALGNPLRLRAAFHNIYGPGAEKTWFFNPQLSGGGALMDLGVHLLDLGLWLLAPSSVQLESAALSGDGPVETAAHLLLALDETPFELEVSWNAARAFTEITFEVVAERGTVRWQNVNGSFFHFRTVRDGKPICEGETTLREDTLRAFSDALARMEAPSIDARVYSLLDRAYARSEVE